MSGIPARGDHPGEGHNHGHFLQACWTVTRGWTSAPTSCPDLLAAFLYRQLLASASASDRRPGEIWDTYHRELSGWASAQGVVQPHVPLRPTMRPHLYYLLMPSLDVRTRFIQQLRQQGINAVFHYLPLHLSDMERKYGGKAGRLLRSRRTSVTGWCGCPCFQHDDGSERPRWCPP